MNCVGGTLTVICGAGVPKGVTVGDTTIGRTGTSRQSANVTPAFCARLLDTSILQPARRLPARKNERASSRMSHPVSVFEPPIDPPMGIVWMPAPNPLIHG